MSARLLPCGAAAAAGLIALASAALAQPQPGARPPASLPARPAPAPPAFTLPEVLNRPPAPQPDLPTPKPPEFHQRRPAEDDASDQLHGRIAPGYDLQMVMRETLARPGFCGLAFSIDNIGNRDFQAVTIQLDVETKGGRSSRPTEIELKDGLQRNHGVTSEVVVGDPCASITEVRLRGFTQCMIDDVATGFCRPPTLTRSASRIRFGL